MKILLLLVVPASMFASVFADPVPIISKTCTVAESPVVCGGGGGTQYGTESVGAEASITILGLNTDTGLFIDASADAVAGTNVLGPVSLSLGSSAIGSVFLDFFASTDGPERQGFATYLLDSFHDGGLGGGGIESVSIQGLGICQIQNCSTHATLTPFQLGTPFEIELSVWATGGSGKHEFTGGSSNAILRLFLFEADGSPVTLFSSPAPSVPETSTWLMMLLGLAGLIARARATERRLRKGFSSAS